MTHKASRWGNRQVICKGVVNVRKKLKVIPGEQGIQRRNSTAKHGAGWTDKWETLSKQKGLFSNSHSTYWALLH